MGVHLKASRDWGDVTPSCLSFSIGWYGDWCASLLFFLFSFTSFHWSRSFHCCLLTHSQNYSPQTLIVNFQVKRGCTILHDPLLMNQLLNMNNLSLLDCMIHPFGQERVSRQRNQAEHAHKGSMALSGSHGDLCSLPRMNSAAGSPPSKSIPISNIKRTASEIQLHEDEALADWRDYVMFSRIVTGMKEKREGINDRFRRSTDQSLANIIRTRNLPVESEYYSSHAPYQPNLLNVTLPGHRLQQRKSPMNDYIVDTEEEHEEGIFILDDLWSFAPFTCTRTSHQKQFWTAFHAGYFRWQLCILLFVPIYNSVETPLCYRPSATPATQFAMLLQF